MFHDPNRNFRFPASFGRRKRLLRVVRDRRQQHFCVRGTRTQPIICVGCSVHYWVTCAINKGGFFEIAFSFVVDTHLPRFEALAYVLPHFDALTHVVILVSSAFIFQRFAEV